jgi:hypothetical protein
VFSVTLTYDPTTNTLTETITDTNTAATATFSYTVDIAAQLGGNVGYVGFTGATSGLTTVGDVQNWTYTFTEPAGPPAPHGGGLGAIGLFGAAELPSAALVTQGSVAVAPAPSSGHHARGLAELVLTASGAPADSWPGWYPPGGAPAVNPNALDAVFAQL